MGYYDYFVILVIGISVLYGIYKGFFSSSISMLSTVLSWIGALIFTDNLAAFFQQKTGVLEQIVYFVQANEKISDVTLRKAELDSLSAATISDAIQNANMPEFFKGFISDNVANRTFNAVSTLGDYFDYTVASVILNILCFVGLLIFIKIIFMIIEAIVEHMVEIPALKMIDGALGAGFGALRGLFFVYVFFALLPVILIVLPDGIVTEYLGDINNAPIASAFYNHNFLLKFIGGFIKVP